MMLRKKTMSTMNTKLNNWSMFGYLEEVDTLDDVDIDDDVDTELEVDKLKIKENWYLNTI